MSPMTRARRRTRKSDRSRMGKNCRAIWLRRLDLVHAELATVRFPRTADESMRLCAALSAASLRGLHESVRQEHPRADATRVRAETAALIARWDRAEAALSRPTRRGGRHQQ